MSEKLDKLRAICIRCGDVTERLSHGQPTWFVKGKRSFVAFADHHHDERVAFICAAPPGAQEALIQGEPLHYFRPPYVGHRGWVGVYMDVPFDWEVIADTIRLAYLTVATKGSVTPGRPGTR